MSPYGTKNFPAAIRPSRSKAAAALLAAGLLRMGLFPSPGFADANPNQEIDRPYTLRLEDPLVLEGEIARQIRSDGPMSFIFPRPCFSELDSSKVCGESHGFTYLDPVRNRRLSVSPVAGYQYRYRGENVNAFEGGGRISGGTGIISFQLDARTFTEMHEDPIPVSYDREPVDRQDQKSSGSVAYSSFSRYRAAVAFDFPWARIAAGRDAVHWGPGLITNLSFNRNAVPFNQATWLSHIGPISVISLYGRLAIDGDSLGGYDHNLNTRSIYAHRYEWQASKNLLLGVSEQLVVYNQEDPFAFIPVIPLFILKGTGVERANNGNISTDFAYRFPGLATVYSEFLIDDLQSPTSIFNDYWGNKWAWMAGVHLVHGVPGGNAGLVLEYSRVEPWVYTHYRPGTAQTANAGIPLGNPLGANSQWIAIKPYFKGAGNWFASAQADFIWKGADLGSFLNDTIVDESIPKSFLQGVDGPEIRVTPAVSYKWRSVFVEAAATLARRTGLSARIQYQY